MSFKDLWNRPDAFRGRRVTVEGRVQRIFRQGPVGSFPALAEIWIASPAGDPFCLVVPQAAGVPKLGQTVRFTGTFLKMVRYAARMVLAWLRLLWVTSRLRQYTKQTRQMAA